MTEQEKRLFESRIDSFIETVHQITLIGEELKMTQQGMSSINPLQYGEELDRHNEQMSQYIKS
jgi:FtsZ-binding cell division protein ZapB